MEVFIKITTENTVDGTRQVAAISFLTFVALGDDGRPTQVPLVKPDSEEEHLVFASRQIRREARLKKREETDQLIREFAAQENDHE